MLFPLYCVSIYCSRCLLPTLADEQIIFRTFIYSGSTRTIFGVVLVWCWCWCWLGLVLVVCWCLLVFVGGDLIELVLFGMSCGCWAKMVCWLLAAGCLGEFWNVHSGFEVV